MENQLIEAKLINGDQILLKLSDISVVREVAKEYPDWKKKYQVCVLTRSWTFDNLEGIKVYNAFKRYLTRATK
jgi:hypothetical protein